MRRAMMTLLALGLAAGCTCAVNPDQYLGEGEDAGPDAMIDAGPDAMIDSGPADAGPPLENLEPEPSGVGFTNYRPALGSTLGTIVGPFQDPNNDAITQTFTWFVDDVEIPGETGPALSLDPATFAVGEEIRVEVGFADDEFEVVIGAGPALIIDDDVERWNLLLPPRSKTAGSAVFDPVHQRMLYFAYDRGEYLGLWEYQLRADGSPSPWVLLANVRGIPPDVGGPAPFADPENGRIIWYGGRRNDPGGGPDEVVADVWTLDVDADNGDEEWAQVPVSGTQPSPRTATIVQPVSFSDDSRALFVYGGIDETLMTASNDAFFLRLGGSGWEMINAAALPMPRVLPVTIFDEDTGNLYLAGGATFGNPVTGNVDIYVMDVDDPSSGFSDTGWDLPNPLFGGGAEVRDGVAYIYGGTDVVMDNESSPSDEVITLDLSTGETDTINAPGLAGPIAFGGSRRPYSDAVMVYNRDFDARVLSFYELELSSGTYTPVTGEGIDMPPPMMQGTGADGRGPGAVFFGGRTNFDTPATGNDGAWEWTAGRFAPMALSGGGPGERWGFAFDGANSFDSNTFFVISGRSESGLEDADIIRARINDGDWTNHPRDAAAPDPPPREGHMIFRGHCQGPDRGALVGMVGGMVFGNHSNETWVADCAIAGTSWDDCEWFDPTVQPADRPTPTAWGAVTQLHSMMSVTNEYTFMFGGDTPTGLTDELMMFRACVGRGGMEAWSRPTISGNRPSPRMGHSFTGRVVTDRVTEAIILFGGEDATGGQTFDDAWRFSWNGDTTAPAASFNQLTPTGSSPRGRVFHIAVYDRAQDRILVYGGLENGDVHDDLWELRLR